MHVQNVNGDKRGINMKQLSMDKPTDCKFYVIACCQGQPLYAGYSTLAGALFGYFCIYMTYKKYHTMNFSLREKLITD